MGQGWISKALEETFRPERYRWYHALAFGSAVNLASGLSGRRAEDRRFYESVEQASFAPPSWAFVPVGGEQREHAVGQPEATQPAGGRPQQEGPASAADGELGLVLHVRLRLFPQEKLDPRLHMDGDHVAPDDR